jgi:hypothetical protein
MEDTSTPVSPAALAKALQESNRDLIWRVVKVIGAERARTLLGQTLEIHAHGGMPRLDGQGQRTLGGIYFYLVKEQVTAKERYRIFGSPGQGQSPSAPVICTWEELLEALKDGPQATGEEASVKITLIGRPATPVQTKGQAVVFRMTGKAPNNLPKGLPPLPKIPPITWTVVVAMRQWNRVRDSLDQHPDDKLLIDGYPCVDGDQHLVLANSCRSLLMEKAQKELQRAERAANPTPGA